MLDNEVKLRILALLTETGAKSITDISKQLNLKFSTAHKYLEQLERTGFVRSKQEHENRLKRMFYIQDFYININPSNISKILKGDKIEHEDSELSDFHIITDHGKLERFDKIKFAKPYLDGGIPKNTIEIGLNSIQNQIRERTSLIEFRAIFEIAIQNRVNSINSALINIEKSRAKIQTFFNYLKLRYPYGLDMHINGDIFIENLGKPKVSNFSHDLNAIALFNNVSNLPDYLMEVTNMVKKLANLGIKEQALDSFNYFISKYTSILDERKIVSELEKFIKNLDAIGVEIFLGLDMGTPRFIQKELEVNFLPPNLMNLEKYVGINTDIILNIFKKIKTNNISLVYKLWTEPKNDLLFIPKSYIANLIPKWQTSNVVYLKNSRLDANWKYWMRTVRVGDIQNIAINAPRIAARTKNLQLFKEELFKIIKESVEVLKYSYELVNSIQSRYLFKKIKYIHLDDSLYSLSLVGLKEAFDILLEGNVNLKDIEIILQATRDYMDNLDVDYIRLGLRDCQKETIANYFYDKDSKVRRLNFSRYSKSLFDNNNVSYSFQKYFNAGHIIKLPLKEFNIDNFIKSEGGFVKIE